MKKTIEFLDAENKKVVAEIEIKEGKGKKVFSMCGQYNNNLGQCFDDVKPKNEPQKTLIALWKEYHLNDMHAGTEEQEKALDSDAFRHYLEFGHSNIPSANSDFEKRELFLQAKGLYEVTLKDGTQYKYGHSWIYKELPCDFENLLNETIAKIEAIEAEEAEEPLTEEEKEEIKTKKENDKFLALIASQELTDRQLLNVSTEDDELFDVEGVDYYVLTEEEADEKCKDSLDKDLWIDAIKADRTTDSFEEWQDEIIQMDGYGSILNSWDGNHDEEKINEVWYYIMRA